MYTIVFMTQAQKDAKKLGAGGLKQKALNLIHIITISCVRTTKSGACSLFCLWIGIDQGLTCRLSVLERGSW